MKCAKCGRTCPPDRGKICAICLKETYKPIHKQEPFIYERSWSGKYYEDKPRAEVDCS